MCCVYDGLEPLNHNNLIPEYYVDELSASNTILLMSSEMRNYRCFRMVKLVRDISCEDVSLR
jgi:hypothetical protein